jgi:hypothetical protein
VISFAVEEKVFPGTKLCTATKMHAKVAAASIILILMCLNFLRREYANHYHW